jgi:hypothetical protein
MSSYYYTTQKNEIEFVYSGDSKTAYDRHSHVSMFAVGLVLKGKLELYYTL